ncbi:MAG: hypothetical protein KVP17_000642 [Porospora cf. gigantea B]|uniref:uncharacterized protein n=1 Tax=Porospora cf. gigantea B TaxID=2853592 RepID=UPI003571A7D7|nr:MAG: hypothetical protein KVP17_000642 [Porospora cf. gigantea B]
MQSLVISADGIVRNETGVPHKPEVADALTKPQLSPESKFRLIVVNQKTTVNLVDDITDDWDVSTEEEFVFYRRPISQSKFKIVGIWLASGSERNELANLIRSVQSNSFIDVDEGARQGQEILDIINGKSTRPMREANPAFPTNDSLSSDSNGQRFFRNHARSFAHNPLESHFSGASGKTELDCLVDQLLCDENLGSCRERRAAFLQLVEEPGFRVQLAKTVREHSQY